MHVVLFHLYSNEPNPAYAEIASALRRRGQTAWVGGPNQAGELEWREGERVIAVQPGPGRLPGWLRGVPLLAPLANHMMRFALMLRVRGFLGRIRPDVVQVNTSSYVWLLPLLMPAGTRFVLDVRQINEMARGDLVSRINDRRLILSLRVHCRFFYDRACFLNVRGAQRVLGDNWPTWGSVVPLGVDPSFLALNRSIPTSSRAGGQVRFIYVGGLSRFRKLDTLLVAIQRLLLETDRFQVDLVGWDRSGGYYHNLVNSLGLGSVVRLRPAVPYHEVPELLDGYDVGLAYVPGRPTWDYHPTIKVLEYRALGLPILSTDVASHREVVEDGVNGLLVQDTVDSIAEGMKRFVMDRDFLGRCRVNARAMRQGVTWDQVARMYEEKVYPAGDPEIAGFLAQGR